MSKEIKTYEDMIKALNYLGNSLNQAAELLEYELSFEVQQQEVSIEDDSTVDDIDHIDGYINDIFKHVEKRVEEILKGYDGDSLYKDVEFAVTRQIPYELGYVNELFNRRSQFDEEAKERLSTIEHLSSLRDSVESEFREMGGLKQRRDNTKSEYHEDEIKKFLRVRCHCSSLLSGLKDLKSTLEKEHESF